MAEVNAGGTVANDLDKWLENYAIEQMLKKLFKDEFVEQGQAPVVAGFLAESVANGVTFGE
jgi:hypothetical protein